MYAGCRLWTQRGIFEHIFTVLREDADMEYFSTDSKFCKVHQSTNGVEKAEYQSVGVSKGGRNTKIHAIVDRLGNPVSFLLSGDHDHDTRYVTPVLSQIEIKVSNILSDKACSAKEIRDFMIAHEARYTIPPKNNNPELWSVDYHTCKERHLVECFFQKLKWFRRVFTRYDKLAFCKFFISAIGIHCGCRVWNILH